MDKRTATACYRELGAELRKAREAAGLTGVELSETELGWSQNRISRAELGYLQLSPVDVISYLAFCGVYGNFGADLHALCREAEPKPGHWIRRHEPGLPEATRTLIYHESTASASTSYEPEFIPGLLQTENYIRALTLERWPNWDPDAAVRIRKDRQQILHRSNPARFTFYVHERALHLVTGGSAIMHEQLLALLLLDGLPHVAVRVVPAIAQAVFGSAFRLLEYTDHQPVMYLDCQFGGLFLEDPEYVDSYRSLIPTIANVALNEGESRVRLATLASQYDRERANLDVHDHVEEKQL